MVLFNLYLQNYGLQPNMREALSGQCQRGLLLDDPESFFFNALSSAVPAIQSHDCAKSITPSWFPQCSNPVQTNRCSCIHNMCGSNNSSIVKLDGESTEDKRATRMTRDSRCSLVSVITMSPTYLRPDGRSQDRTATPWKRISMTVNSILYKCTVFRRNKQVGGWLHENLSTHTLIFNHVRNLYPISP
jgi:hypothetical protein